MSSKARRVRTAQVHSFPWRPRTAVPGAEALPGSPPIVAASAPAVAHVQPHEPAVPHAPVVPHAPIEHASEGDARAHFEALEREAFARGHEIGERAAGDATRARVEAMLTRLGDTMEELATLRRRILLRTEREMVELALALAGRIVRRDVAIDREIVVAIARVAIERLGERHGVTVRLNPQDFAFAVSHHGEHWAGGGVTALADPEIPSGGCRVESPFGSIDAGIEAQLAELARGILPEAGPGSTGG